MIMAESVKSPENVEYKLIGAECSMYTGKARSYMKWKGIPFKEVTASASVYKDIIIPHTTVAFMPVLLIVHPSPNDASRRWETIQDTKDIIDYFETTSPPSSSPSASLTERGINHLVLPSTPKRAFATMIFELLADEWLAMQGMFWRWGDGDWEKDKFEEQMRFLEFEFGSMSTAGRRGMDVEEVRKIGREAMAFFRNANADYLGITPVTGPVFRQNFQTLLKLLSKHFEQHPFLLGESISLADFAFYGTFYAHLSRDPIPSYILKTTAPLVWEWVERISGLGRYAGREVERWDEEDRSFVSDYGSHRTADDVPPTMSAVAKLLLHDHLPILSSTVSATIQYLKDQPSTSEPIFLPRFLDHHPFTISGSSDPGADKAVGSHALRTHAVWMLQRIIDRTCRTTERRQAADSWMLEVGGEKMLEVWRRCVQEWEECGWRVGRKDNKIYAFSSTA